MPTNKNTESSRNNSIPRKEELVGDVIFDDTLGGSGQETAEMKKGMRNVSSRVQSLWELVASNENCLSWDKTE